MKSSSRAIPFILKNPQTQVYELCPQAEEFLTNITTPLSVVAVAGLYRTGKSYLLNRVILNKSEGFNVGPTINPCTKGLWIWNESIHTQDKKNVLVIDTEGLGALDQQANHDMKIFCLAVLLSTTFIYNSVGNIDQNALQTLSLVLNLVSNIDQESQTSKPSFIWVVRDFSLQLIDQKGNTISPKQYLQMALNSDGVKESQKASIRKNITGAFKDRDCFTLYKPLIDETKLQKLDTIPLQELRPEFVSQTMALRKKIFGNLHEVSLSESALKGGEYVMMVKKYLTAINQGKVPNIGDTWTFIKEEKARQVSYELIQTYAQKVNNKVVPRLPIRFSQLDELMSHVWEELVDQFKRLTYEDTSIEQIQQFFHRIKSQVKSANQEQMKAFLKNLLNKEFQVFSKKMFSDYYQCIEELSSDIEKNFKQMLIQTYSQKVEGLNASISSFLEKKYIDAFKYFSAKFKLEIKRLSENKEEIQQEYRNQIDTLKKASSSYQNQLKTKLQEMDKRIFEVTKLYQQSQKALQAQKQSNKGRGFQTRSKLESMQQTIHSLQQRSEESDAQKQQLEKEIFMMKKQHQKELALMKQKNEYLSKQHEDQERRYEDMKKLLDEKMTVQEQEKKKFYTSSEERFKTMVQESQAKSDKIFQLEQKILELSDQYSEKIFKLEQRESKLLEERQKMKSNLIQDFSNKKQSHTNQLNNLRDECRKYEQQLEISLIQKTELQTRVKNMSEELKHVKYNAQKQIAIHLQRIQFHQAEIKELKFSNEQMKKNYQSMIENIQFSSRNNEDKYSVKIKELTETYQTQIKNMDREFSEKIYETKKELSTFKTTRQDLQIQLSLEKKRHENKEKQFKESYAKLQTLYKTLTEKLSTSEKDFHSINQEKQQYFTLRIRQLEAEIQQTKEKSVRELQESQRSSQQALAVLKNYTQMERHQWQKRLQDEKQKNNRYVQNLKAEYEKRMMQEKQALEQENSMLEQKIDQMQKYFNQTLQNMKYDYQIEAQKLTNQFTQEKVQISKKNALLTQQIQLTKMNMQNQIEESKRNYEQTIQSLKYELENEIKQLQIKFQQEKTFLESKCESLKKTNRSVQQQNLILKNELDKEKALFKEKESSHLKNINDLEERLAQELFNHTKTLETISSANNAEKMRLNQQIDSLNVTKRTLEEEYSKLAKDKEIIESNLSSMVTNLQTKIKSNKADYDDLMNKFEVTSTFLNKNIEKLKKEKLDISSKLKQEFEHQISIKEDNYKKQNKDYNDRIYRLQTENKSLRDKVILMEVKLASFNNNNNTQESSQFEKLQEMKEEYMKREEEYRKLIDRLKKENKKLKEEKEIMELTNNYQKSKIMQQQQNCSNNHTHKDYKDSSERDSIINGLNDYSRHDASRSRINLDNSKIINTNTFNQSRMSSNINLNNALNENKNVINRKSNVSPMVGNKKYSNTGNINGGNIINGEGHRRHVRQQQEDYDGSRYY